MSSIKDEIKFLVGGDFLHTGTAKKRGDRLKVIISNNNGINEIIKILSVNYKGIDDTQG